MSELTLIRHGQAQTGAKDEDSYDKLSDLGHEQANWLGAHFRHSHGYDLVISGAMTRQIQTAQSLKLTAPHRQDARINEMDYFGLADSLLKTHNVPWPTSEAEFTSHLPQILNAWRTGEIVDGLETYEAFCERIIGAVTDAVQQNGRVLLVTSTGVIATLATLALDLNIHKKSNLFMSVAHTSVHKFTLKGNVLHLSQFGGTPHLDYPDRLFAKTFA
ncbi:MAG: histidine phosphatase family protein [Paracoccaceae bacterium]